MAQHKPLTWSGLSEQQGKRLAGVVMRPGKTILSEGCRRRPQPTLQFARKGGQQALQNQTRHQGGRASCIFQFYGGTVPSVANSRVDTNLSLTLGLRRFVASIIRQCLHETCLFRRAPAGHCHTYESACQGSLKESYIAPSIKDDVSHRQGHDVLGQLDFSSLPVAFAI